MKMIVKNQDIVDVSKDILKGIKESDPYLDFNLPTSAIIYDLYEPSDDEKDVTIEDLSSADDEPELIIVKTAVYQKDIIKLDTNTVSIDTGPAQSYSAKYGCRAG